MIFVPNWRTIKDPEWWVQYLKDMGLDSELIVLQYHYINTLSWITNLIHQSGIVKRYLKEALDKYFDDYVDNEVIHDDLMDILSIRMSAAVNEVNKVFGS